MSLWRGGCTMAQEPANVRQGYDQTSVAAPSYTEAKEAVVIVHGTFANNSNWIQPNSHFIRELGLRIGPRAIHIFIWSGENSHKARTEAGEQLARFVDGLRLTGSVRRVWCITHSHGGNVA